MSYALQLSTTQFLIIIGIAVSGVAAFVNTYDAIAGISNLEPTIQESADLQKALSTRFYVFLGISIVLIAIGAVLAYSFSNSPNKRKVISYGLITAGILGLIYALTNRFKGYSIGAKLAVSWIALIVFIALGFFFSKAANYKLDFIASDFNADI